MSICNLCVEDLVLNGHPSFLANEDGTCKTANCQHVQIGKHPSRIQPELGNNFI